MSRRRMASSAAEGAGAAGSKKGRASKEKEEGQEEDENMEIKYKLTPAAVASGLPIIVKATLSCLQASRDYESILIDVGLVSKDTNIVKKMKKSTSEWSELVQKDGKGHQHGPPHLRAWGALLLALIDEDIGAMNKEQLTKAHREFEEMTVEQKGLDVRLCRLRKCYDKTLLKLQFAVRGNQETLRGVIRNSLTQCKVDMKSGRAPTTAMERKLQEMLENWQI
jgi:hypothetical protein